MDSITDGDDCHPQTSTIVDDGSFAVDSSAALPVAPGESMTFEGWARIPWSVMDRLPEFGPNGAAVLLALYRHANASGRCYPGVRRIAEKAGISIPTARKAIRTLEQLGIITIERRVTSYGNDDSPMYSLPQLGEKAACPPPKGFYPGMGNGFTQEGQNPLPGVGNGFATKNDISEEQTREESKRERAPAPPDSRLLFLIDQWNERKLGPTVRRDPPPKNVLRNWQAMLKDQDGRSLIDTEDALTTLLDSVTRNTWATSQPAWGITWLLTRNGAGEWKAAKLLRGEYGNSSSRLGKSAVSSATVYDPSARSDI